MKFIPLLEICLFVIVHCTQTGNFAFAFPEILSDSSPDPYEVQYHLGKQCDVVGFTAGTSWRKYDSST